MPALKSLRWTCSICINGLLPGELSGARGALLRRVPLLRLALLMVRDLCRRPRQPHHTSDEWERPTDVPTRASYLRLRQLATDAAGFQPADFRLLRAAPAFLARLGLRALAVRLAVPPESLLAPLAKACDALCATRTPGSAALPRSSK